MTKGMFHRAILIAALAGVLGGAAAVRGDALNGARWVSRGLANISGVVTALLTDPEQSDVYLAATGGGLFTTSDAGASWSPVPSLEGRFLWWLARDPARHDVLWAGALALGDVPGLYRSSDRGRTWSEVTPLHATSVFSVAVSPTEAKVIVATNDGLQITTDDGATWKSLSFPPLFAPQVRFHPRDGSRAIAVLGRRVPSGIAAAAYATNDGGATWHEVAGIDHNVQGLTIEYAPSQPSIVYAFSTGRSYADKGTMWRSDDGGESFRAVAQNDNVGDGMRVIGLFVSPAEPGFVVDGAVWLYRSNSGGQTHDRIDSLAAGRYTPHADYHGFAADPHFDGAANRCILAFGDGGVYRTPDILATTPQWIHLPNGMVNAQIYSMDVSRSGAVILGMQDVGVGILPAGGGAAKPLGDGDFYHVAFDPTDDAVYFAENFPGLIYRSTEVSFPHIDTTGGRSNASADFVIDPNQPSRIFAGSGIVVRAEGVQSKPVVTTLLTNPAGVSTRALAVQRGNSNVLWMADTSGAVYRTDDALGAAPSWRKVRDGSPLEGPVVRIVIDADDPKRVFLLRRNGLELTRDGGTTWSSLTRRMPAAMTGAGFQDLVRHPQRADWLYIGTQHGLWSSADGGAIWSLVSHSTLQVISVTALRFASGGNVLWASTYGRGAWSAEISPATPRRRVANR